MSYITQCMVLILVAGKAHSSCKVSDFGVQQNFDIKRYVGVTWYEQKLLPVKYFPVEKLFHNYQHVHYLHPDGTSITMYHNGRDPSNDDQCSYSTRDLLVTDTPGKWLIKSYFQENHYDDYWIIATDYSSFSIVYSCVQKNVEGECTEPHTWVYSRTPQLPDDTASIIEGILDALCVNKSALLVVEQNNECPLNKECAIYSIDKRRMQNFDVQRGLLNINQAGHSQEVKILTTLESHAIFGSNFAYTFIEHCPDTGMQNKFVGKWFEIKWLPPQPIPEDQIFTDIKGHFDLSSDETLLSVFLSTRESSNLEQCDSYIGQLVSTSEDGKFIERRFINSTYLSSNDFWIMDTDYNNFAVFYGCLQMDSTGLCTQAHADSWILSRHTELPADKRPVVENITQSLCVNTSHYLAMEHTNECPDIRDCTVASITQHMVNNYDAEQIKGIWYRYSYFSTLQQEAFTDYMIEIKSPVSDDAGQSTTTTEMKVRYTARNNTCEYTKQVSHDTEIPGKSVITYNTSTGTIEVESYLMSTDYESYFVSFSCLGQDEHSKCNKPEVSLWSRSTTIAPEKFANAQIAIMGMCLNYDTFKKVEHVNECPLDTPRNCSVASITQHMVQDYDAERIKGIWYRYSYFSTIVREAFTEYMIDIKSPVSDDAGQSTTTTEMRVRYTARPNTCAYTEQISHYTEIPGKGVITYKTSTGHIEVEAYLMSTDYESYFVSYSCLGQDENSKCNKPEVSLWSRSTTIPPEKFAEANLTINGLCLNYGVFETVENLNACPSKPLSKGSHASGGIFLMVSSILIAFHRKLL